MKPELLVVRDTPVSLQRCRASRPEPQLPLLLERGHGKLAWQPGWLVYVTGEHVGRLAVASEADGVTYVGLCDRSRFNAAGVEPAEFREDWLRQLFELATEVR